MKFPALGSIKDVPRFLTAVKLSLELLTGARDAGSRAATLDDLAQQIDAAKVQVLNQVEQGALDSSIPPAPANLTATGALGLILLEWTRASFSNYAYTEIWRAEVDDIGQAVRVGTAIAAVYADSIGSGAGRYYWIRFVSTSNITGPFNQVNGTYGATGYDPDYVRSVLASSVWTALTVYGPYQTVAPTVDYLIGGVRAVFQAIDGGTSGASEPTWSNAAAFGDTVTDGDITWKAVPAGSVPFAIGTVAGREVVFIDTASIKDATITTAKIFSLAADKIIAGTIAAAIEMTSATVTGGLIRTVSGTGTRVEVSGVDAYPLWFGSGAKSDANGRVYIKSDGTVVLRDHNGNALITLTSTTSDIALGNNVALRSGQTAFDTGVGWWLGSDGSTPKFSIKTSGGDYFKFDGVNVYASGRIFGKPYEPGSNVILASDAEVGIGTESWATAKRFIVTRYGTLTLTWSDHDAYADSEVRVTNNGVTLNTYSVGALWANRSLDINVEPDDDIRIDGKVGATSYANSTTVVIKDARLGCAFWPDSKVVQ